MISKAVINLCQEVGQMGGRALLVGGWVRDYLRGRETADYDIEVYGIEATALRGLLNRLGQVNAVGEAFTVYKVRLREGGSQFIVDVSLPRRESKIGRGHKGFVVTGDPAMSFEEAARRRDFTINAILHDPLTAEFIDPFDGRKDIEARLIRVVDPATFIEDSLRVLRAMQFASRFEFEIDPATVDLCRSIDLSDLPSERIEAEVEKWLLLSSRPSIGLYAARELKIVDKLWHGIRAMIDCPQDELRHPEGDVFAHTARTLDEAAGLISDLPRPKQLTLMLASLCHDFGKPLTTKFDQEAVTAFNHQLAGLGPAEAFLDKLKIFTLDGYDVRRQVLSLIRNHLTPARWFESMTRGEPVTDGDFRRLALTVEPDLLYRMERASRLGRRGGSTTVAEDWFIDRVRTLGIQQRAPEPLLLGRHVLALGLKEGPEIGRITNAVYQMQLDGSISDLDQAIDCAKEEITKQTK